MVLEMRSLDDLKGAVAAVRDCLVHPIILFTGDLGAGKTTMIKEIMHQMGCDDQGSSPSYSIINEYQGSDGPIYHIDLYRMNTVEETFALGIEEIIYSGRPCFIEWPEIIIDYIEGAYHTLKLSINENNYREIRFS